MPSTLTTWKEVLNVLPVRDDSWWKRSLREVVARPACFLSTSEMTEAAPGIGLLSSLTLEARVLARLDEATKLKMLE